MKAALGTDLRPMGKGLACILTSDADATGACARADDRAAVATGYRSYSPLEGRPAFAGTHVLSIAQGTLSIKHYES